MRKTIESLLTPGVIRRLGFGMRDALRGGYGARDLRRDVMAGLIVGIVALPLAMALSIASGAPPQHGLYTSIVAGTLIAVTGGSRVSVSGPTAAFVVLLAPITQTYGIGGLMTASLMAGCILLLFGLLRPARCSSAPRRRRSARWRASAARPAR